MLIVAIIFIIFVLALFFAIGGPLGAPWVPIFKKDLDSFLDDAELKQDELFIELGCGDGRLLDAAARRGANCVGYEINPVMWLVSWLRNLRHGNKVRVVLGNFWGKDLSAADVVVVFLTPRFMQKLETKVEAEMKPGSRFVSYVFQLPNRPARLARHHWWVYDL